MVNTQPKRCAQYEKTEREITIDARIFVLNKNRNESNTQIFTVLKQ